MSTQEEVNASVYQYVLYYINATHGDTGVYPIDLTGVCIPTFDDFGQVVCVDWTLGASFPAPSNAELLTYVSATVLAWYANYYTIPADINDFQFYKISSSALSAIRADASMIGFQVFDTTSKTQRVFNGVSWAATSAATSSVSSAWSSSSVSVVFGANTPQLISVGDFTQTENIGSEWKVDTSSGKHTYSGQTRPFRVTVNFTNARLAPLATQTVTSFLSKNGSTVINGKRVEEKFTLTSTGSGDHCLSCNLSLTSDDYIQLGAEYSTVDTIAFSSISYDINGC
jgi:hypothetical protein